MDHLLYGKNRSKVTISACFSRGYVLNCFASGSIVVSFFMVEFGRGFVNEALTSRSQPKEALPYARRLLELVPDNAGLRAFVSEIEREAQ